MKRPIVIFFTLLGTSVGPDGHAQGVFGRHAAPSAAVLFQPVAEERVRKPLWDVLKTIDRRVPGRALDAREIDVSGEPAYRIKWMGRNGQVHDIIANAQSGKIVKMR